MKESTFSFFGSIGIAVLFLLVNFTTRIIIVNNNVPSIDSVVYTFGVNVIFLSIIMGLATSLKNDLNLVVAKLLSKQTDLERNISDLNGTNSHLIQELNIYQFKSKFYNFLLNGGIGVIAEPEFKGFSFVSAMKGKSSNSITIENILWSFYATPGDISLVLLNDDNKGVSFLNLTLSKGQILLLEVTKKPSDSREIMNIAGIQVNVNDVQEENGMCWSIYNSPLLLVENQETASEVVEA